jgi:hypothetical protein
LENLFSCFFFFFLFLFLLLLFGIACTLAYWDSPWVNYHVFYIFSEFPFYCVCSQCFCVLPILRWISKYISSVSPQDWRRTRKSCPVTIPVSHSNWNPVSQFKIKTIWSFSKPEIQNKNLKHSCPCTCVAAFFSLETVKFLSIYFQNSVYKLDNLIFKLFVTPPSLHFPVTFDVVLSPFLKPVRQVHEHLEIEY